MSTNDPEQIRADIERTRAALSNDVDSLTDQANPKNIAQHQVDKAKDRATGLKDKVMGSASDSASSVSSTASNAGDNLAAVPGQAKAKTQGNPLAAGLIAFGAGLLVSSLIPASRKEQQLAAGVKDNTEPLTQQLADRAKEVADHLKAPAQDAAESVKATATDAVDTVKQDSSTAVTDVQDQAHQSKDNLQQTR